MTPIRFDALPVSPWRNGAGRKADIDSADGWHVGFAWLDMDAPFSDFDGHDRTITLIDGPGFALEFPHRVLPVTALYRPTAFDGGVPTHCRLQGGPCIVLNAMTMRAGYRHRVVVGGGATTVTPQPDELCFVVVLAGSFTHGATILTPRDAVQLTTATTFQGAADARLCTIGIAPAAA